MTNKPHILVATPTGGKVDVGYLHSCLVLQKNFGIRGWGLNFTFKISPYVHRARNEMALQVINGDKYTHILFIDSDIEFHPDTVAKMIELNKGIVTVVYPFKKYINGQLRYMGEPKEGAEQQADGTIEVQKIGAGFLLIEKSILSELIPFCTKVRYDTSSEESGEINEKTRIETWNFFDFTYDENNVELGEDISFCAKCEKAGIPIWTLLSENLVHWGLHNFQGNTKNFLTNNMRLC